MKAITNLCLSTEKLLNYAGYIPLVSEVTGAARIFLFGPAQSMIASVGIVIHVPLAAGGKALGRPVFYAKMLNRVVFFVNLLLHGGLNVMRGLVEVVPVIGNIACFAKDYAYGGVSVLPRVIPHLPSVATSLVAVAA
jgi:hypothetical protein